MSSSQIPKLELRQEQKQVQRLSQVQIKALSYLSMGNESLRNEIYRAVSDNPALEIKKEPSYQSYQTDERYSSRYSYSDSTDQYQQMLENQEGYGETLQEHLLHQLNSMKISEEENELCTRLIYNLDKNGFYGSGRSPQTFLPGKNPAAEKLLLERCLKLVQAMDPLGTCCRNFEESLLVQAQFSDNPNPLALFILDGHLQDIADPPDPQVILRKLKDFKDKWHKKAFAPEIVLDTIPLDEASVSAALKFIQSLNPRPAQGYGYESGMDNNRPDVVLIVTKEEGSAIDDYSLGKVSLNSDYHFQIKYASGELPEIDISSDFKIDKENLSKAQLFLNMLEFRKKMIIRQGCAIVHAQKNFFLNGPGHLKVLTRRQIAQELEIHESTVSRMSSKKGSKYIQTEWGLFPASYFFTSGVKNRDGSRKISSERIKQKMETILSKPENQNISDRELCLMLNEKGARIARRTVAKYRAQLGLKNSYRR